MKKENTMQDEVMLFTNVNLMLSIEYLNKYVDDLKNNKTKITDYDKELFKTINNISELLIRY